MVFLDTPVNKLVVPSFRVRGPDEFHDGINGFPGRCFVENKKVIFTERMFQNGIVGKAGNVRVHVFFRFWIGFRGHIRGDGKIPANSIFKGGRDGIPSFQTEIIHAMRISLRYALSDAEPGRDGLSRLMVRHLSQAESVFHSCMGPGSSDAFTIISPDNKALSFLEHAPKRKLMKRGRKTAGRRRRSIYSFFLYSFYCMSKE